MSIQLTRRQFLKAAAFTAAMIPFTGLRNLSLAALPPLPAGQTAVPADDAVANAMGYKPDAKDVDKAKYSKSAKAPKGKKPLCDNCDRYTPVDKNWGNCSMITSGLVSAKGWCASYSPKTK